MKNQLLLILFVFSAAIGLRAQNCSTGFGALGVRIVPDQFPTEISWRVTNPQNGQTLAQGGSVGDTICIPENSCVLVEIFDTYGDGIFSPGGYWITYNNLPVANGAAFGSYASHSVACAPGSSCDSPEAITPGTHTATFDNAWFSFSPTISGMYVLSTCGLSTCDTRLYVYQDCPPSTNMTSGPEGTYAYNDNAPCGLQSSVNVMMLAGQLYRIRVGDTDDDCSGSIEFSLAYNGAITGCTDITACNYNPLAETNDGSCIYYPNPACAGPDLAFDSLAFVNSLTIFNHNAANCDITEGCVTGYGQRTVIAFSSKIDNIGTMDYYLGNPSTQPDMFNTVNCHGHTHYEGYGDYRLYDAEGNLIPAGHKNGFCVMDLCGFGQYNCGNMGISAGCYDVYGVGTQCQWIDVTEVPDGVYRLAVIVNPLHLPDALGRHEINYVNNALQLCFSLSRVNNQVQWEIIEECSQFVDCNGVLGGSAVLDCNGVCGGSGLYGNVMNTDANLNMADIMGYMEELEEDEVGFAPCYDLNGDGSISVFDAALLNWCFHSNAGNNSLECTWPRNILNPLDSVSLSIANVNFTAGYVDVAIRSERADVMAYQFRMSGIHISDAVALTEPLAQPKLLGFNASRNEVFSIYHGDSAMSANLASQNLVRIYFDEITGPEICISEILEINNNDGERTVTSIAGACVEVEGVGIGTALARTHLTIMPNPASDAVFVQVPEGFGKNSVWEIFDLSGKSAGALRPAQGISPGLLEFPVAQLPSGVYLLRATSADGQVASGKIVKF